MLLSCGTSYINNLPFFLKENYRMKIFQSPCLPNHMPVGSQATMLISAILRKSCGRLGIKTHGSFDSAELPQYCGSVVISVLSVPLLPQYCPKNVNKFNFYPVLRQYCGTIFVRTVFRSFAAVLPKKSQ